MLSFQEFANWYVNNTQKYQIKSGGENCFSLPQGTYLAFEWYKKQYNDVQVLKSPAKEVRLMPRQGLCLDWAQVSTYACTLT